MICCVITSTTWRFLTYEKFVALAGTRPQFLEELGVVVLDEIQMIEDDSRGRTLELLLVRLQRVRRQRAWPQLIVLCAELANFESLQTWLGLTVIGTSHRPVPLSEGVLEPSGRVTLRRPSQGAPSVSLYPGFPAIPKAGRQARYENDARAHSAIALARHLIVSQTQAGAFLLSERLASDAPCGMVGRGSWSASGRRLSRCIGPGGRNTATPGPSALWSAVAGKGVAFHIGDLG